ncbi:antibiotic biosynthesis monooxygenase family protein [Aureimonas sp. ME7]|uniref:antibiotic biosynthesis monooxygenase family protein n=1 Tax=Aureimonas sp. ME7 TaxID=2744252 RepID=UPI0015F75141|nr:antibiotic biosynthesis monooxygenase family protein [Aureimonas sp. ME7]
MFLEIAEIVAKPGEEQALERAAAAARPLFLRARGCAGMEFHRVVEQPGSYKLIVRWVTVEDHTVRFRGSEDFQEWRRLAGPHFAEPPVVVHTRDVLD